MLLNHAGTLNVIHTREDLVKVNSLSVSVCFRLHWRAMLTYSAQQLRSPESYQAGSLCWTGP